MKLPFAVLALAVSITACSSDQESGLLTGTWGGNGMLVSATRSSTIMSLGCGATVRVSHPIVLDGSGGFAFVDSVRGSFEGGERDTLPGHPIVPALIVGKISGDQLTMSLQLNYGSLAVGDSIAVSGTRGQAEAEQICRA